MASSSNCFLIEKSGKGYTYSMLLNRLTSTKAIEKYIQKQSLFDFFGSLLAALIHQIDVVILDPDFSEMEIENLLKKNKEKRDAEAQFVPPISSLHWEELKEKIKTSKATLTLFTSGTTGQPKQVTHAIQNFVASAKTDKKFENNKWALAYNATHMAGLQVFFQAFLNQNLIVDVFSDEKSVFLEKMKNYQITHLSATPTFYRLLMPPDFSLPEVKNVTLGGEKSDLQLFEKLKLVFPFAKFTNIYASTEAGALFHAKNNVFEIKENLLPFVKIENQQLFLHAQLLGKMDIENNQWYATGDLVEIVSESPLTFSFVSRNNEMINVGGNKVNPNEVEAVIADFKGIKKARVYGKPNSVLGNILMAEFEAPLPIQTKDIREFLKTRLQEFKIPRIINQVDHIEITRSGKLKRT